MAQEIGRVIYQLQGKWFDSWLLHFARQSVHGQDTEPQIVLDASINCVHIALKGCAIVVCSLSAHRE